MSGDGIGYIKFTGDMGPPAPQDYMNMSASSRASETFEGSVYARKKALEKAPLTDRGDGKKTYYDELYDMCVSGKKRRYNAVVEGSSDSIENNESADDYVCGLHRDNIDVAVKLRDGNGIVVKIAPDGRNSIQQGGVTVKATPPVPSNDFNADHNDVKPPPLPINKPARNKNVIA